MWQYQTPDELYHYGVKGMKWGVRRYQNKDGTLTDAGKKRSSNSSRSKGQDSEKIVRNILSKNQPVGDVDPALIQLGAIAAFTAVAYGRAAIARKKEIKAFDKELDEMYVSRKYKSLKDVPKLKKPMSPEESMKLINPKYPDVDAVQNCMLCTTAMVMREKGYDVKAGNIMHGLYVENINRMFGKGGEIKKVRSLGHKKWLKTLASEGDGAYGNLLVSWNVGGSHSVFWKNINGKTHIYDGQSGEEYDISSLNDSQFLKAINPWYTQYSRLDNVQVNELVLSAIN